MHVPVRLSIIIPSADRPHLLGQTLASLTAQAGVPPGTVEVLIADDGRHTRVAPGIAQAPLGALPPPRVLAPQPARGQAEAVNRGLAAATGDYALILHDDDLLAPGALAALLAALAQQAPEAAALSLRPFSGDPPAAADPPEAPRLLEPALLARQMLSVRTFVPSQLVFRPAPTRRYDPRLDYLCDWAFCALLLGEAHAAGGRVLLLGPPGTLYRQHVSALSHGLAGAAGFAVEHVVLLRLFLTEMRLFARLALSPLAQARFLAKAVRWRGRRLGEMGVTAATRAAFAAAVAAHLARLAPRFPALLPDPQAVHDALARAGTEPLPVRWRRSLAQFGAAATLWRGRRADAFALTL